ncbi:hypothetical protein VP06_33460 [Methylobacterium aquaticum]|uniref:Uncharacterized protein n=1 Tax=Methylobacterium aquaticum TaxID=270351 RepID=A0A0J6UDM1_9HYPH|nr:hypothetical protein VP06_33460 [Methylobacterium aquaticum]
MSATLGRAARSGGPRRRAGTRPALGGEARQRRLDARNLEHRDLGRLPHRLESLGLRRRDADREDDPAGGVDDDLRQAAGGRQAGSRRIDRHARERLQHVVPGDRHVASLLSAMRIWSRVM